MSFSIGQPEQSGLDLILQQLGGGVAQGLQQNLEQFHQAKQKEALESQFEGLGLPRELAGIDPRIAKQYMASQQKQALMEQLFGPPQEGAETLHPGETPGVDSQYQPSKEISAREVEAASLLNPSLGRAKQQERKFQQQERRIIKKRNLEVFDKASAALRTVKQADIGVQQLQNLSNKIGETQGQSFFERLGRTYRFDKQGGFTKIGKATSTPQEERYVKLIADQTKTIKDDFGARITNLDLQVFLRRFPDLMMTPAGRKEIFETMRDYHEAKRIYNEALKNEIKLTKGRTDPYELDEIVEEKINPKLDKIRKRIAQRGFSIGDQGEGQAITTQIAQDLLIEAKGDREEARKIAKERGYVF